MRNTTSSGKDRDLLSIKNEAALERLSFAARYVVIDSSRIIDALRSNRYDIRTTVALSQEPDEKPGRCVRFVSRRRHSLGTRASILFGAVGEVHAELPEGGR